MCVSYYLYFNCLTTGEVFVLLFFVFHSEVCPFCGKTYKRLKSHLPHCKAAVSSDTPPISREAAQTQGLSRLSSLEEEKIPQKLTVSAGLQSKKSKKVSAVASQTGLQPGNSSPSQMASSASLSSSAKKKKQKLSEQIRAAAAPPSTAVSPTSQPRSLHPTTSKTKTTTVHDFIEAAGPQKAIKGAPKRTRAAVETPSAAQRVAQAKISSEEGIPPPACQPTGGQGSSKMKVTKKKATQSLSLSQNYEPNERTAGACERNHDWVTTERKKNHLSVNMDSGNGLQSKITLQDVTAALGRDRKTLKPSRPGILVHIQSLDPSSRVAASATLPTGNQEEQSLSTSSTSPSKPASTNPMRHHASPPLARASLPPLPPSALSPQVHRAVTGLWTASPSLTQFKLLPASVETPGDRDGLIKDKMHLEDRKPQIPDIRTKG